MLKQSLESAIELMLANISPLPSEQIHTSHAIGRIISMDIESGMDIPPFNRSPLDGYAVKAADTGRAADTCPVRLTVIDEVHAGGYSEKIVKKGEAVRIMTGALMPDGCDCVVAQENTDYGESTVEIYKSHHPYQNFCYRGEDIEKGALVIKEGEKLRYIHLGILASLGIPVLTVVKKPVAALFITGDELCPIDEPLPKGKIYNSNLYLIASRMAELSVEPELVFGIPDDGKSLADSIAKSAETADLIITTGGVSAGKKDIIHETLNALNANTIFKGVDFKPGSPTIFSLYKNKPILSLSGNPFAAITTFELLARPILYKMTNDPVFLTRRITAEVKQGFKKRSGIRRFVRGKHEEGGVIIPQSDKTDKHSSGVIGSMLECNCLVDIEAGNGGLLQGDKVNVVLLDSCY